MLVPATIVPAGIATSYTSPSPLYAPRVTPRELRSLGAEGIGPVHELTCLISFLSGEESWPVAYRDLGATTPKRQGRADAQRGGAGLRGRRGELDRDGAVDRLEDSHGEVRQRGASDGVGERAPAGHARVGRVHP